MHAKIPHTFSVNFQLQSLEFPISISSRSLSCLWSLKCWPKPDRDWLPHWYPGIIVCPTADVHRLAGTPVAVLLLWDGVPFGHCLSHFCAPLKSVGRGCRHLPSPQNSSALTCRVYFESSPGSLPIYLVLVTCLVSVHRDRTPRSIKQYQTHIR